MIPFYRERVPYTDQMREVDRLMIEVYQSQIIRWS